jgi:type II secretory pathway component PulF
MVSRFMTVLEPALVLLMALMVGFVVFALFQPLLCLFQCWGCSGGCM